MLAARILDFFLLSVPAFVGRMLGAPVCDGCSEVDWRGVKHAYANGWRSQTDGVGPNFWSTRCPACQEGPEVMW